MFDFKVFAITTWFCSENVPKDWVIFQQQFRIFFLNQTFEY